MRQGFHDFYMREYLEVYVQDPSHVILLVHCTHLKDSIMLHVVAESETEGE